MDENQNTPLNEVEGMPQEPSYPSQNFSGTYSSAYTDENAGTTSDPNAGKTCSIISLVLGILGIVLCCASGFSIVLSIAAIVLAAVSRKQRGSFNGLAIAGLVCGIVGTVFCLIVIIFSVLAVLGAAESPEIMDYINSLS